MRRIAQWIRTLLLGIVLIALLLVLLDVVLVLGYAHYQPEIGKADAVVIMGAAINTPALYNRTLEGLHLYEQGKAEVMVLSGGRISDADISEAQYMEKVINRNSATPPPVILEQSSRNTYENLKNSREKLKPGSSIIIVSDEFHLARAVLTAKALGYGQVYWSSPEPDYYSEPELQRYYAREVAAMITYVPKFIRH